MQIIFQNIWFTLSFRWHRVINTVTQHQGVQVRWKPYRKKYLFILKKSNLSEYPWRHPVCSLTVTKVCVLHKGECVWASTVEVIEDNCGDGWETGLNFPTSHIRDYITLHFTCRYLYCTAAVSLSRKQNNSECFPSLKIMNMQGPK